ncbi:hypothetical protein [Tenacibaculum piscium]|uniref:Uncharacterized protein n=1 Tax=Tenacibaculum piscium TaxID=1458515 RepID=A0A2H1YH24_9FLAO|nr:hypothetical protein [Tenacibaculum piscium]MBE7630468.1 hypothetical protein [Tenacibaculum piscium]MBE7671656.1 hypothetical protein [Tenacibaculum piscium]SOS74778.1 conserved membrane hypothetical protein [Tenacibaculum piscium]
MKKIDYKVVGVAIFLLVISIYSYTNWNSVAKFLMTFLESKILTFGIWILLVITSVIHYNKNYDEDENMISDKEGLDKPIDYLLFVLTYGAIGSSVQVLAKETFANYNFKELSKCAEFSGFDNASFFIVIIVLIFYSYGKIKPIIQETYIVKSKIRLEETEKQ